MARTRSRPTGHVALSTATLLAVLLAGCSGAAEPGAGSGEDEPSTATDAGARHTDAGSATSDASDDTDADADQSGTAAPGTSTAAPTLEVEVVMEGLVIPWDVQFLPDGTALVTERAGQLLARSPDGKVHEVTTDLHVTSAGEAGLMGIAVSPDVAEDRRIFLCHASEDGAGPDVRVTRLNLDEELTTATTDRVVVDSIPFTSGRHSGCRLLFTPDGTLLVGTGDAADNTNPQDLASLGGKVLAVTADGAPASADDAIDGADPRILTYGHRNVQGLAIQPSSGDVWEVEHGPDIDDEVNVLRPGANYGWDPGSGYDESVPMTDLEKFPDAVEAVWSSGDPTHATSGAVFLEGSQWGAWDGALAVAELKGSGITVLTVDGQEVTDSTRMPELDGTYGRLRSVTLGPDGSLWVTSSIGHDDVVLRVAPQAR